MNSKDYVTYQTAKLLEAAGYKTSDAWPHTYYTPDGSLNLNAAPLAKLQFGEIIAAPHLWDAMKWLREEHKLFVEIRVDLDNKFCWGLCDLIHPSNDIASEQMELSYPTYESACDNGIAAACKWLIG